MKLAYNQISILLLMTEHKFAHLMKDLQAEQNIMQHMSILKTQMGVQREQSMVKKSFHNQ